MRLFKISFIYFFICSWQLYLLVVLFVVVVIFSWLEIHFKKLGEIDSYHKFNNSINVSATNTIVTSNAACCKNHRDLLHLSFILSISIFLEAYLEPSQKPMMEFFATIVSRYYFHVKSSITDARLGSKYACAFTLRLFSSFISLKCFTSFNLLNML